MRIKNWIRLQSIETYIFRNKSRTRLLRHNNDNDNNTNDLNNVSNNNDDNNNDKIL